MAISDEDLVEFFQNQASSSASQSAASTPPSSYPSSPPPVDVEDEDEDVPVTQLFQSDKRKAHTNSKLCAYLFALFYCANKVANGEAHVLEVSIASSPAVKESQAPSKQKVALEV